MTYSLTLPRRRHHRRRLQSALLGLIERHGRWRVIRAALFARPSHLLRLEDLGPAARRDLNLPQDTPEMPHQKQLLLR
ncbi:hypothetical protein K3556_02520 [Aliiroseovarius sp. M344]|uniref:hypothetical protein n=1 Tax=Aliiroseovarius sp. M344 TaxID=2867010 RepID=UPI0021AD6B07|nr:hypothetical protein [Aliiroseovarius sp. M344]UWQ14789.1 hypothetical protein K3556_02520 [Aliiroseovarius sp. M344]